MREMLQRHPKGRDYGHILKGCERYPLIVDDQDRVLSFPPIINGELTATPATLIQDMSELRARAESPLTGCST